MTSTPLRPARTSPARSTADPATPDIAVATNSAGETVIRWDMAVGQADALMTLLARIALTEPDSEAAHLIDPLWLAVSQATSGPVDGCEDLWPDAAPMPLTEPAVCGNDTGDLLAILIPGQPTPLEAINTALAVAREAGAEIDPADTGLVAEVQKPRWMVLNACDSHRHDFHPELAAHGPLTPGAVLATQVDIVRA